MNRIVLVSSGLLALTILCSVLILYFALVNQSEFQMFAILSTNITDMVVNAIMVFAMIWGFFQV